MATWSPSNTKSSPTLRVLKTALRPQRQMVLSSSSEWASSMSRSEPGKERVRKSVRIP